MQLILNLVLSTVMATASINDGSTIQIESDKAVHDRHSNTSEWSGTVVVSDNEHTLTSESLIAIYNDQNQIIKLIAKGNPVTASGPNDSTIVSIEGETIVYESSPQIATATGNARYNNGTVDMHAESILYRFVQRQLESRGRSVNEIKTQTGL